MSLHYHVHCIIPCKQACLNYIYLMITLKVLLFSQALLVSILLFTLCCIEMYAKWECFLCEALLSKGV